MISLINGGRDVQKKIDIESCLFESISLIEERGGKTSQFSIYVELKRLNKKSIKDTTKLIVLLNRGAPNTPSPV
jgi:hypothetical protein